MTRARTGWTRAAGASPMRCGAVSGHAGMDRSKDINPVPTIELTDEEHAALVTYVLDKLREEKFLHAPRLNPVRSALAKLNAASATQPIVGRPPLPEAPMRAAAAAGQRPGNRHSAIHRG